MWRPHNSPTSGPEKAGQVPSPGVASGRSGAKWGSNQLSDHSTGRAPPHPQRLQMGTRQKGEDVPSQGATRGVPPQEALPETTVKMTVMSF